MSTPVTFTWEFFNPPPPPGNKGVYFSYVSVFSELTDYN